MIKVLLVDDHHSILRMVTRRLKKIGYEIHTAENGHVGVEKALELLPDLVLMDMHMPVMDGYKAASILREQNYKGTIVSLTASAMADDTKKAIEAGCNGVITKPIDCDFENTIQDFLKEKY